MEEVLRSLGFTDLQAKAYLFIIAEGQVSPPRLASELKLTRTNAYKLLDTLIDSGLLYRKEINKKYVYMAANPDALATLLEARRGHIQNMEQQLNRYLPQLRASYASAISNIGIDTYYDKEASKIITKLDNSWQSLQNPGYHAEVSWFTNAQELLIIRTGDAPMVIKISDPVIAEAAAQICTLLQPEK